MNSVQPGLAAFRLWLIRRPLSAAAAVLAVTLILIALYQLFSGSVYLDLLNWVDWTTLIMLAVLLLRGIHRLRLDTDLQAVSIALIGALSFVFMYEAIYKLSFYTFLWRMPPGELRELVIQVATALTALVGFAFGKFSLSRSSQIFLGLFIALWIFWLLIGFPQLESGTNFYPAILNLALTHEMIYVLIRATKASLCLVYFFLYKIS